MLSTRKVLKYNTNDNPIKYNKPIDNSQNSNGDFYSGASKASIENKTTF